MNETSRLFEAGLSIEQVSLVTDHKDWQSRDRFPTASHGGFPMNTGFIDAAPHVGRAA